MDPWIRWLWNGGLDPATADPFALRQRRTVSGLIGALAVGPVVLFVSDLVMGERGLVLAVEVAMALAAPGILVVQAALNRPRLAAHAALAVLYGGIAAVVFTGKGLFSTTIAWLAFVPLLAAFLSLGPWTMAWGGLALATLWAAVVVAPGNPAIYALFDATPAYRALDYSVFLGVVSLAAAWHARATTAEQRRLRQLNAALRWENTERRQAEQLALDKAAEAEEAAASRERFLATVSHELRTPLNGVVGAAELLRGTPLAPDQAALLGTVHGSARTLLLLINDLLDLSKLAAGRLVCEEVPVHLRELVEQMADGLRGAAGAKGLSLAVDWDEEVPDGVVGDPVRLRQIMLNLLGNAIKFTERGGVTLRVRAAGGRLFLAVEDTGIGIPAAVRERLFVAFEQAESSTARRFGGTGLGLAIVKRLCQAMAGDVTVDSVVGEGSTFTVDLPHRPVEVEPSRRTPTPPAEAGARRVLVVDDNAVNLLVATKMLERDGHAVVAVASGEEAVERVRCEAFDLVLMDCQMPGMDGYATTRALRGLGYAALPIVALTANTAPADRRAALDAGMDGHLSKPIDAATLRRTVAAFTRPVEPPGGFTPSAA